FALADANKGFLLGLRGLLRHLYVAHLDFLCSAEGSVPRINSACCYIHFCINPKDYPMIKATTDSSTNSSRGSTNSLFEMGSHLRKGTTGAGGQQLFLQGGRQADVFYRNRWAFDKMVRSTHGVNCTGSCSWKVYVKDGVITWESQAVDYPTNGNDMPEYEPRGCPRGASFSWYTYSPTRIRYPYARGVLVDMYREAKERLKDPVLAWRDIQQDPDKRQAYISQRGK